MFVIVGATGKVGGSAVSELLRRGREVRAVVRPPARGAHLVQLGCELAIADVQDREMLTRAFAGAEAVLAICPLRVAAEDVAADARITIDALGAALEASRPKRVVAVSDYAAQHAEGTGI